MQKKLRSSLKYKETLRWLGALGMMIVMLAGMDSFKAAAASGYFGAALCMAYAATITLLAIWGTWPEEDESGD